MVTMYKKILFINNLGTASVIPGLLVSNSYDIDVAPDSATGLQLLDKRSHDLVIVMEDPAAEIWLLCENIRRLTNVPLIIVSANASTETCVKAINAGADYFLRKPFGPQELLARLDSLFQRASLRQTVPVASQ
jgi:two-component system OmpR family response regulator